MSGYVGAPALRRAERNFFLVVRVKAETQCHVLSSRVAATDDSFQLTCGLSLSTSPSSNRGTAGVNFMSRRSGNITPELTGRAYNTEIIQVLDENQANSRSG
jgi:hypothetical protein